MCEKKKENVAFLCDVLTPKIIPDKVPNLLRCLRWSAHSTSVSPKRAAKPRPCRSPIALGRVGVGVGVRVGFRFRVWVRARAVRRPLVI